MHVTARVVQERVVTALFSTAGGYGHPELLQGEAVSDAKVQLIGETDGAMAPIVTMDSSQNDDQRKTREVCWKEVRLALVYEDGKRRSYQDRKRHWR